MTTTADDGNWPEDVWRSFQAIRLRVTRLRPDGSPIGPSTTHEPPGGVIVHHGTVNDPEAVKRRWDARATGWRYVWWRFVHNTLIHPLFGLGLSPGWLERAHDWTGDRCWGAG